MRSNKDSVDQKFDNCVIIDANFILLPIQFKIDFLGEIRLSLEGKVKFIIFKQVLNELDAKTRRESKATKFPLYLKSGLLYLEKNKEKYDIFYEDAVKFNNESMDDFLLRHSIVIKKEKMKVFLATNDYELRKKARKANINVIFLRQRKYLALDRI